jgi:hypothetical protein
MNRLQLVGGSLLLCCAPSVVTGQTLCTGKVAEDTVRPIPPSLYAFADTLFGEDSASHTVYRCMDDRAYVCEIGNGFSCERPSTDRHNLGANRWCRENPGSDSVPMAASGHGTIYGWKCLGKRAVVDCTQRLDERGFRAEMWTLLSGAK